MKQIINNEILQQVVKDSLKKHNVLQESYVSEPKAFKQVSDMVSQKTKNGHTELYNDYSKTLNQVSAELDSAQREEANSRHAQFRSLKLDEAYNMNAKWLHELYFENCFSPSSELYMDSLAYMRLQRDFGTFEKWQEDFIACAMSCGQGWAICGYNIYLKKYVNTIVSCHSDSVMMGIVPIVVLDMWEHAYVRDYVVDKQSYVVAMMQELNWNVIEQRIAQADKLGSL